MHLDEMLYKPQPTFLSRLLCPLGFHTWRWLRYYNLHALKCVRCWETRDAYTSLLHD